MPHCGKIVAAVFWQFSAGTGSVVRLSRPLSQNR
jgi:hypothetical protein